MAKLIFGMNQSLDGYVDHQEFAPPSPTLFRHFIDQVRGLTGSVYGRRLYEVMSYWDEDRPKWSPEEGESAAAWRFPELGMSLYWDRCVWDERLGCCASWWDAQRGRPV